MAARLALATLPAGFLPLAPRHPPRGGASWWQRLKTLTNTCGDRLFFLFFSFLSSLPQAKHSTCSFLLPSHKASPVWWHFHSLAWEGRCVHGPWFLWFPGETRVATHVCAFLLISFFRQQLGTTPLFHSCKHVACGNLAITQGTSEV